MSTYEDALAKISPLGFWLIILVKLFIVLHTMDETTLKLLKVIEEKAVC